MGPCLSSDFGESCADDGWQVMTVDNAVDEGMMGRAASAMDGTCLRHHQRVDQDAPRKLT